MPARKFRQWQMMIAAMVSLCASTAAPAFEQSFPTAQCALSFRRQRAA